MLCKRKEYKIDRNKATIYTFFLQNMVTFYGFLAENVTQLIIIGFTNGKALDLERNGQCNVIWKREKWY